MGIAYEIQMSRSVLGSPSRGFAIMKDVESFPRFMPNVVSVRLIDAAHERKVAEWEITLDGTPLSWVEEGLYDDTTCTVTFRALEGLFDRFDGHWRMEREADGCRISFLLVYEIGLPEIEHLIAPIMKARMEENALSMLAALEAEMSSGGAAR